MTFPSQFSVKKRALQSAGLLLALAISLFTAFCALSYCEETEAFRLEEPYDSIGSSYLWLATTTVVAAIGSVAAIAIYFGTAFTAKPTRHRQ